MKQRTVISIIVGAEATATASAITITTLTTPHHDGLELRQTSLRQPPDEIRNIELSSELHSRQNEYTLKLYINAF